MSDAPRPSLTRADAERALRAAGAPSRLAKKILAGGWAAAVRDDGGDVAEIADALRKVLALVENDHAPSQPSTGGAEPADAASQHEARNALAVPGGRPGGFAPSRAQSEDAPLDASGTGGN